MGNIDFRIFVFFCISNVSPIASGSWFQYSKNVRKYGSKGIICLILARKGQELQCSVDWMLYWCKIMSDSGYLRDLQFDLDAELISLIDTVNFYKYFPLSFPLPS